MTLLVRPEASHDILEAARWYEARREGLGTEFVDTINATFEHIVAKPIRFTRTYRGLRRALVQRFPYAVYFDEAGPHMIILAVVHQRRDFKILDERLG